MLFSHIIHKSVCTKVFQNVRYWHIRSSADLCTSSKSSIKITFLEGRKGDRISVDAQIGKSVLDVAVENHIDIEGACGGQMACSTCHVIVPKEYYDKLPKPVEEENDMLDLASGLTETSRLCCQIKVTELLEDVIFTIPEETNNML